MNKEKNNLIQNKVYTANPQLGTISDKTTLMTVIKKEATLPPVITFTIFAGLSQSPVHYSQFSYAGPICFLPTSNRTQKLSNQVKSSWAIFLHT